MKKVTPLTEIQMEAMDQFNKSPEGKELTLIDKKRDRIMWSLFATMMIMMLVFVFAFAPSQVRGMTPYEETVSIWSAVVFFLVLGLFCYNEHRRNVEVRQPRREFRKLIGIDES